MASTRKAKTTSDIFNGRTTKETYDLKPHPITGRLIDAHPGTRTIPMKVLLLGLSRTGTMSLFNALERLGYRPYHMSKAIQAPRSNLDVWREGLDAKYNGRGEVWGVDEFDKVLGAYDAVADVPCVSFAEELIAAYPDAKVILSTRDVDAWLGSMQSTAGTVLKWPGWAWLAPWDPALVQPFWRFANVVMPATYCTLNDFSATSPARAAFERHYTRVREVTPADRLLEYRVQEGWRPLCEFLGVDVPGEEFPKLNDKNMFIFAHAVMWWMGVGKLVLKSSLVAAPFVAGLVAWRRSGIFKP